MPADERAPAAEALSPGATLALLGEGQVVLRGRMPWSSNATFLAEVSHDGAVLPAVYKPMRGERPLWDFPSGLYVREVAAYRLSETLGWGLVPETVLRRDGPLGPGSLQRFVPADFSGHYFTLLEDPRHHDALRAVCAFDVLANNADRKAGHCLLGDDGRIWAIDNALCFHASPNLRSVIWDFAGEPVPAGLLADVERVASAGPWGVEDLLGGAEVEALAQRAAALVAHGVFPDPGSARRAYPWPLV